MKGSEPRPVLDVRDVWSIVKTSFGTISAMGILTGGIALTSIVTKYSGINLQGIAADCIHYYKVFFHDKIDAFIEWLCVRCNFEFLHIPNYLKDWGLIIFLLLLMNHRTVDALKRLKFQESLSGDKQLYIERTYKPIPLNRGELIRTIAKWTNARKRSVRAFAFFVQFVSVVLIMLGFIFFGAIE